MEIIWNQDVDKDHLDSVWYGGTVATITYSHYKIYIKACGDISANINGEHYRDKNNGGCFREYLNENGIYTDADLEKADIEWWDNNWFEFQIWDEDVKDWVDNGIDNVIDIDPDDNFEWLLDWIHDYEADM